MKKSFFVALLLGVSFMFSFSSCDKDDDTVLDETPAEVQAYANTHFPNNAILKVVKGTDDGLITFDATLENNIVLQFNEAKEIIEIDSDVELPDSVVPVKIRAYTQANYPNNIIIGWELEETEQEADLDDGVELVFDLAGDFLRVAQ